MTSACNPADCVCSKDSRDESKTKSRKQCPSDNGKCPVDLKVSIYLDKELVKTLEMSFPQYNGFIMCYSILNKDGKYSMLTEGVTE